jgi:hypothetical protein
VMRKRRAALSDPAKAGIRLLNVGGVDQLCL